MSPSSVAGTMSERTERFLIVYFRALALSCSAPKRAVQRLLTVYVALVLGDMTVQLWRYWDASFLSNNIQLHQRQQLRFYMRIINIMKASYLTMHLLIVAQALIWRNRERRLLALLPQSLPAGSRINVRFHLTLEGVISSCVLLLSFSSLPQLGHLITNLRYLFNTQAVRARYLQMALFVRRLDVQLQQLQLELEQAGAGARGSQVELRSRYAHLVRLSAHISRFFGFSILLMNLLCIGDFIVVCYSYIVLWQLSDTTLSWMLLCQTVYVLIPALVNIWTLCAACHKCASRSQQLQLLLNAACQQQRSRCRTRTIIHMAASRSGTNEFALQIMQNPVQFDACGIYNLNLNTLAGMFLFILQSLVIFLQFVELVKQQIN